MDEPERYKIRKGLIVTPQERGGRGRSTPLEKPLNIKWGEEARPMSQAPFRLFSGRCYRVRRAARAWAAWGTSSWCVHSAWPRARTHTPTASSLRCRMKAPLESGGAWEPVSLRHGMGFARLGRREPEKAQEMWENLNSPCSHMLPIALAPFSRAVRSA